MPNPTEKEVKELEDFLTEFAGDLLETSRELIEMKLTKFPVYIIHKEAVEVGQVLLDRIELEQPYYISVSTLEEFIDNDYIDTNKRKDFETAYGDPLKQMCLLWVLGDDANFVFFPFASQVEDQNN